MSFTTRCHQASSALNHAAGTLMLVGIGATLWFGHAPQRNITKTFQALGGYVDVAREGSPIKVYMKEGPKGAKGTVHPVLEKGMQQVAEKCGGFAVLVTDNHRDEPVPAADGTVAKKSLHMIKKPVNIAGIEIPMPMAVDFRVIGCSPTELAEATQQVWRVKGGVGCYPTHMHIDLGPPRRWVMRGAEEICGR